MTPVRNLDKVRLWEEVIDNGVVKYAPVRNGNEIEGKKYFRGNMQELKSHGHTIFL